MLRSVSILVVALLLSVTAAAQSVPIKSIPVAEGDQFWLFPSSRAGMGGVGIALDDRLYDPFVNPAKGVDLDGSHFVSTPVYYGFGPLNGRDGEGSGRTLPLGAFVHRNNGFAGVMAAFQELTTPRPAFCCAIPTATMRTTTDESEISTSNMYLFGMGGIEIPGSDWAVGLSAFHANLGGMEGVNLLYSGGGVRQDGSMQQYRAGVSRKWATGQSAELVLLHHRFEMTHRMDQFTGEGSSVREERDETRSFAVQAGYAHSLSTGLSIGARVVGDWKWHPKIPNYDLMQIPRDPGNSAAYNFGVGLASTSGAATFGIDFIYEPIWSHTWADAIESTQTAGGGVIPPGSMTVENYFEFSNAIIRMGVERQGEQVDFGVGVGMHHISYDLDQMNFVEDQRRLLDQRWTEWTLSSSVGTTFSGFRLQYAGRLTLGTGMPFVRQPAAPNAVGFDMANGDWVVAPNGPLALDETKVLSHQLTILVPLAN